MKKIEQILEDLIDFYKKESQWRKIEHAAIIFFLIYLLKQVRKNGGIKKNIVRFFTQNKLVQKGLNSILEKEAKKTIEGLMMNKPKPSINEIPREGLAHDEIFKILDQRQKHDVDPHAGKTFAYVYSYTKEHCEMTAQVFNKFVHTNVLNPMKFISLRNMEVEVVAMAASMFNGDESFTGSVSSGGSESILLAMKSYRDYYRKNHPGCDYKPEVIMCETAHPAFHKAFQLFNIQPVIIKMDQNYKMRIDETKKAINKRTCCIIVSAPAYPHGIMDPIPEIAEIGYQANIPVHVDSAIGGFYLPWLKKLGIAIPDFDFKNRGVTSINADTHKYGFAPKGSSVVIYRNPEVRVCQFSTYGEWCGGLYVSPTLLGTRNGGPIAAAWASLVGMGQSGFIDSTKKTLEVANEIKEAVKQIPEIDLVGEPKGIILAIQSKDKSKFNIYHLADALETLGYSIERQANPDSIHCTIMMQHYYNKGVFVEDLKKCVQLVRDDPKKYAGSESSAAMYGMLGQIPDGAIVEDFLAKFLDQVYSY